MILKKYSLVLLIFLLNVVISNAYSEEYEFLKNEITFKLKDTNQAKTEVRIRKNVLSTMPYKNALIWGGDEMNMPKTIITFVSVKANDEEFFVPFSAYSDLGNPRHVTLTKNKKGFEIQVSGGETSTSYKAILFFRSGVIYRRKVISNEFPNQVWEDTTYSFISRDSNM